MSNVSADHLNERLRVLHNALQEIGDQVTCIEVLLRETDMPGVAATTIGPNLREIRTVALLARSVLREIDSGIG